MSIVRMAALAACVALGACADKDAGEGAEELAGGTAWGAESGTSSDATTAAGTGSGCANLGESCVAVACCGALECIAGRVCGDAVPGSTGSAPSATTTDSATTSGGDESGSQGSSGGPGMCMQEFSDCSMIPCCAGLECMAGDLGQTCTDPAGGEDGLPTSSAGDAPATSGGGDGDGGGTAGGDR